MNICIHLFGTATISWPFYIFLSHLMWKRNISMIQKLTNTIVSHRILDIYINKCTAIDLLLYIHSIGICNYSLNLLMKQPWGICPFSVYHYMLWLVILIKEHHSWWNIDMSCTAARMFFNLQITCRQYIVSTHYDSHLLTH